MITGWQLLQYAGDHLGEIQAACVRVDERFGQVPVAELRTWLERMVFFDDPRADDWPAGPVPPDHDYRFIVWTDKRIWWSSSRDGVARLEWQPLTPAEWIVATAMFEPGLVEIGTGRTWRFGRVK